MKWANLKEKNKNRRFKGTYAHVFAIDEQILDLHANHAI